ncbi:MAG TPA: carbonic anhydrase [Pseudomonas sp.]|nr:carbonic anhydrase [Pseudomonas sp.]
MQKNLLVRAIAAAGLLLSGLAQASESHWGYAGEHGPEHWGKLASEFATCSAGKNQSPVDLRESAAVKAELPPIELDYRPGGHEVVNNGHTIQVNYQPGSSMIVGGHRYELRQFHFHAPSENVRDGKPYPMEVHFVHADQDGNLAVLGVMYELGGRNGELAKAWEVMPKEAGGKGAPAQLLDARALVPADRAHFRFTGSLTTPPCSEGVSWFVLKATDQAAPEQVAHFAETIRHDNNRPPQPLNARLVLH